MAQVYRLRPREVSAVRFYDNDETLIKLSSFLGCDISVHYNQPQPRLVINYDDLEAFEGDYIVKHPNGAIEVYNKPYFEHLYTIKVGE